MEDTLCRLPLKVPIDYFPPGYWNTELTVKEKIQYMDNGIALPLPEFCESHDEVAKWKTLPADEFMERYGNAKLALYQMPTKEEIALAMAEDDSKDEMDEE